MRKLGVEEWLVSAVMSVYTRAPSFIESTSIRLACDRSLLPLIMYVCRPIAMGMIHQMTK